MASARVSQIDGSKKRAINNAKRLGIVAFVLFVAAGAIVWWLVHKNGNVIECNGVTTADGRRCMMNSANSPIQNLVIYGPPGATFGNPIPGIYRLRGIINYRDPGASALSQPIRTSSDFRRPARGSDTHALPKQQTRIRSGC